LYGTGDGMNTPDDIETILDDYFDDMVDDSEIEKIKTISQQIKVELEE